MITTTAIVLIAVGGVVGVAVLCSVAYLLGRRSVGRLRTRLERLELLFGEEQDWIDRQLVKVAEREADGLAALADQIHDLQPASYRPRERFTSPAARTTPLALPPAPPKVRLTPESEAALLSPTTYLQLVKENRVPAGDAALWTPPTEVAAVHVERPLRDADTTTIPAVVEDVTGELVAA